MEQIVGTSCTGPSVPAAVAVVGLVAEAFAAVRLEMGMEWVLGSRGVGASSLAVVEPFHVHQELKAFD